MDAPLLRQVDLFGGETFFPRLNRDDHDIAWQEENREAEVIRVRFSRPKPMFFPYHLKLFCQNMNRAKFPFRDTLTRLKRISLLEHNKEGLLIKSRIGGKMTTSNGKKTYLSRDFKSTKPQSYTFEVSSHLFYIREIVKRCKSLGHLNLSLQDLLKNGLRYYKAFKGGRFVKKLELENIKCLIGNGPNSRIKPEPHPKMNVVVSRILRATTVKHTMKVNFWVNRDLFSFLRVNSHSARTIKNLSVGIGSGVLIDSGISTLYKYFQNLEWLNLNL